MKRYEALAVDLQAFECMDDFEREFVADYISCPSSDDCSYDGGTDKSCCTECKIKWLLEEWE